MIDDSNIEKIGNAVALGKKAFDTIASALRLIKSDTDRKTAEVALQQARQALETAEVTTAVSLGHNIHHCDFPPGICILRQNQWVCRKCGESFSSNEITGGGAWG